MAGADRGHEGVFGTRARQCALQVVDVALDRRVAGILHRARTGEAVHARAAAPRLRAAHAAVFRVELGELLALLAAERPRAAAFLGDRLGEARSRRDGRTRRTTKLRNRLPARMALPNSPSLTTSIPAVGLAADHIGNCRLQPWQQRAVRRVVAIKLEQIIRPRQAADMRGQNPADAALHGVSSRRLFVFTLPGQGNRMWI